MTEPAATARRGPKPKAQVRENLLRTGVRTLHGGGFSATGIQDIVAAAGVPKGSFYNYFENKEAFAAEVIDFYFTQHLPRLQAELGNAAIEPLERLRAYFENRKRGFAQNGYCLGCMLGNLSLEMADHSPAMRERLAAHFQAWSELIRHCIEQAQRSGTIATRLPASVLAQFVLNSWEGALLRMRAQKSAEPLDIFMETVFGVLLAAAPAAL